MKSVRNEVEELDRCLDFAVSSACETLKREYGSDDVFTATYEEFFKAFDLQANMDTSDLYLFVPAFVYCDTKGYVIGSLEANTLKYTWTEMKPYSFKTDDFEIDFYLDDTFYVKSGIYSALSDYETYFAEPGAKLRDYEVHENGVAKGVFDAYSFEFTKQNFHSLKSDAIIKSIQESVTERINIHNSITKKMGYKYIYSAPTFYTLDIEYPSFIVCFQGYPLKAPGKYYNNLHVRSGYIGKKE
jgi:hypothetical protein